MRERLESILSQFECQPDSSVFESTRQPIVEAIQQYNANAQGMSDSRDLLANVLARRASWALATNYDGLRRGMLEEHLRIAMQLHRETIGWACRPITQNAEFREFMVNNISGKYSGYRYLEDIVQTDDPDDDERRGRFLLSAWLGYDPKYLAYEAIEGHKNDALRLMLECGLDPETLAPTDPETSLLCAVARAQNHGAAAILIEAGADPERVVAEGQNSPRQEAEEVGAKRVLAVMNGETVNISASIEFAKRIRAAAENWDPPMHFHQDLAGAFEDASDFVDALLQHEPESANALWETVEGTSGNMLLVALLLNAAGYRDDEIGDGIVEGAATSGDLKVDGVVAGEVIVGGDLHAHSVILAGDDFVVGGNVKVRDFIYSQHGGSIAVCGDLETDALISLDDPYMEVDGEQKLAKEVDDKEDLAEIFTPEIVEAIEEEGDGAEVLLEALRNGKTVLL